MLSYTATMRCCRCFRTVDEELHTQAHEGSEDGEHEQLSGYHSMEGYRFVSTGIRTDQPYDALYCPACLEDTGAEPVLEDGDSKMYNFMNASDIQILATEGLDSELSAMYHGAGALIEAGELSERGVAHLGNLNWDSKNRLHIAGQIYEISVKKVKE